MLKQPTILFGSLLLAAALAFGLARLFEARFERGDIYPPYSTLRADPLGASVLYESLERVPGVTPQRYFEAEWQEEQGNGRGMFVLGLDAYQFSWLSRDEFETIQRFVQSGGRLVVAFHPEFKREWSERELDRELSEERKRVEDRVERHEQEQKKRTGQDGDDAAKERRKAVRKMRDERSDPTGQREEQEEMEARHESKIVDLHHEWGFHVAFKSSRTNETEARPVRYGKIAKDDGYLSDSNSGSNKEEVIEALVAKRATDDATLPGAVTIHTAMYFAELTNGWTTVYAHGTNSVVIERKLGRGAIVLLADAYPFSNEAMLKDRESRLLAWTLGSGRDITFDEAHLGVVTNPGVASLMRKYHLEGLIYSLLVVALLFIWKNSLSLVPPHTAAETMDGPVVAGRDSSAGFVNLLRRGIPPRDILGVCFSEWKKSCARLTTISPDQRQEAEKLAQQSMQPVETYRAISEILKRKKP